MGTQAGNAIAEVLFGDHNPSGKITATFPAVTGQVPYYYYHKNTGRPMDPDQKYTSKYIDGPNAPLYPFGYGLSYTTFEYDNLSLDKTTISASDSLQVSVEVTNTGDFAGEEVVQLYIRDLVATVTRPVKELRDFEKIELEPGETKTVSFTLTPEDLIMYDVDMNRVVEPGKFKVFAGTNSEEVLEGSFRVE